MPDEVAGRLSDAFKASLKNMLGENVSVRVKILPIEEYKGIEVPGRRELGYRNRASQLFY